MLLQISLVVLVALLNGFFALSEMALMVARKSRLKHLAVTSRRAKAALGLAQQPESFLATVQVFITLLQIGAGASLGATIGERIGIRLDALDLPWIDQYSLPIGVGIAVSGITFVQMLLGELVPKRVALVDPERFAMATALPMRILTWLATPFAFLLIWMTRLLKSACSSPRASIRA